MMSHSLVEHLFVNAARQLLADSGRGCFILLSHAVRKLRERVLPDGIVIRKLVKLSELALPMLCVEPVLACVERTADESKIEIVDGSV